MMALIGKELTQLAFVVAWSDNDEETSGYFKRVCR